MLTTTFEPPRNPDTGKSPCAGALPIAWYPGTWRGHFPQLSLEDRLIWSRWLDRHAHDFDAYAYDVAVGGLDCDDPDLPETTRRQWRYCTAKRIDVLAVRACAPTIIEVRYQAGVSAIGALLVYRYLFAEHNPTLDPAPLILLTDHIAPDTRRAAESYRITVTELPA